MNNWTEKDNKLEREFEFTDFKEALDFVNKVGALAEEANHHPDILLHDYKKVLLTLTTHSEGSVVTEKDRALAEEINRISIEK
ncbi:MAG: 4a-hydroxytetrahydrobiopterin dehydratase [bacterium]|nr:4a-hydroxytetrahydrobiopterin dehydratase [bacterium]